MWIIFCDAKVYSKRLFRCVGSISGTHWDGATLAAAVVSLSGGSVNGAFSTIFCDSSRRYVHEWHRLFARFTRKNTETHTGQSAPSVCSSRSASQLQFRPRVIRRVHGVLFLHKRNGSSRSVVQHTVINRCVPTSAPCSGVCKKFCGASDIWTSFF